MIRAQVATELFKGDLPMGQEITVGQEITGGGVRFELLIVLEAFLRRSKLLMAPAVEPKRERGILCFEVASTIPGNRGHGWPIG